MAAPDFVPVPPGRPRSYESPPRRDDPWMPERPGEVAAGQPEGLGFGWQGPDQGYALRLVKTYIDKVHLRDRESWTDVAHGAVLVGLKRASLFGRAPVIHDLDIAFRLWGFLDADPDPELVELRREMFAGVANPHHYLEARRITAAVPEDVLRQTPQTVASRQGKNWRDQLDLASIGATGDAH